MGSAVPAIVMAGDRGAARTVYGESKVYLDIAGRPLVGHVVATLQRVPDVSSVWVVGDAARLEAVFAEAGLRDELCKPLHVVDQFENLYENAWQTYRRTLPGAPAEGRDPESDADRDHQVLYLSGDLPFATPQEISELIRSAQAMGCDFGIGMSAEPSLELFHPVAGAPDPSGVEVTYFNLREARLKQNNLHLTKPARILNRHYIQDMYLHRKQREIGSMTGMAWRLLTVENGGGTLAFFYGVLHLAGLFDRWHWRRLADWARRIVSVARAERALSRLMKTEARFVITEAGGCAIDVDTEEEYDAIRAGYVRMLSAATERAEAIGGPLPLPERAMDPAS